MTNKLKMLNEILTYGYYTGGDTTASDLLYKSSYFKEFEKKYKSKSYDGAITFRKAIEDKFLKIKNHDKTAIALSGGIDSSYIAYICSKIKKINTITIGFSSEDPDVIAARKFSKIIKSKHLEIIIDNSKIKSYYEDAIQAMKEPVDLGSVLQTYILFKSAAEHGFKYLVMGDGADEICGGYKRHQEILFEDDKFKFYKNRIIKFNIDERKEILNVQTLPLLVPNIRENDLNNILRWDIENELIFYHLKRIINISNYWDVTPVLPYFNVDLIKKNLAYPYELKVSKELNKIQLRSEAKDNGLPLDYVYMQKRPTKIKNNMKDIIKQNVIKCYNETK